jgi:hypothetical protein
MSARDFFFVVSSKGKLSQWRGSPHLFVDKRLKNTDDCLAIRPKRSPQRNIVALTL